MTTSSMSALAKPGGGTRALVAWMSFAIGVVFVTVEIVTLHIGGLFILGVALLVLWAFLIGAFTRAFWSAER